jgi:hypothetical protein
MSEMEAALEPLKPARWRSHLRQGCHAAMKSHCYVTFYPMRGGAHSRQKNMPVIALKVLKLGDNKAPFFWKPSYYTYLSGVVTFSKKYVPSFKKMFKMYSAYIGIGDERMYVS